MATDAATETATDATTRRGVPFMTAGGLIARPAWAATAASVRERADGLRRFSLVLGGARRSPPSRPPPPCRLNAAPAPAPNESPAPSPLPPSPARRGVSYDEMD